MAKKPGKLQRAILEKLQSYSCLPILQNKLMWDLALERDEIEKNGKSFGAKDQIEEGTRKKSFEINFRRAMRELSEDGKVIILRRNLVALDEIFALLPYLTDRLEIHRVRNLLLPAVKRYITDESPVIHLDPFGFQIEKLKNGNRHVYGELIEKWREIEIEIVRLLQDTRSPHFESWIGVLVWGRSYFMASKLTSSLKLPDVVKAEEEDIISKVKALIGMVESHHEYKIGNAKQVLYALFSAPRFGKTTLADGLRRFLFNKEEAVLRSLPGDEDARHFGSRPFGRDEEYNYRNRKFSPLLDQLFTRHIFRELSFLSIQ